MFPKGSMEMMEMVFGPSTRFTMWVNMETVTSTGTELISTVLPSSVTPLTHSSGLLVV